MAGDGLADWLALHEVDAAQMRALMADAPPGPKTAVAAEIPLAADEVWALAALALAEAFPDRAALVHHARDETRRNLNADPARFPRAFTLWERPPYVSCPTASTARGVLTLAHEFGHALQVWSTDSPPSPPILREMAATLAECALLDHLRRSLPTLHPPAEAAFDAATRRIMTGPRQRLETALQVGTGVYRYDWNYPPARAVALRLWRQADRARMWQVFDGSLSLAGMPGGS